MLACLAAMAAPEPEAGAAAAQARVTQLEETLEAMAETLRHGVVILEDYKMESQESLWNKMCARTASLSLTVTATSSPRNSAVRISCALP